MMKKNSSLKDELRRMAAKSQKALQTAKNNLRDGDYESACSKAYYSVFHIMQAALLTKGLSYSKHSGVISGFSLHFVKAGIFPKDFSRRIRQLMQDREIGDYSYFLTIAKDKAEEDIHSAEEIIEQVMLYLRRIEPK